MTGTRDDVALAALDGLRRRVDFYQRRYQQVVDNDGTTRRMGVTVSKAKRLVADAERLREDVNALALALDSFFSGTPVGRPKAKAKKKKAHVKVSVPKS